MKRGGHEDGMICSARAGTHVPLHAQRLLRCASDLYGVTEMMCDRDPIKTAMKKEQVRERERYRRKRRFSPPLSREKVFPSHPLLLLSSRPQAYVHKRPDRTTINLIHQPVLRVRPPQKTAWETRMSAPRTANDVIRMLRRPSRIGSRCRRPDGARRSTADTL